jgi:hypothetical protein
MKKLMIVFLFIPILGFAQTKKDIFNPDVPLVFFGADYAKAQFTKSDEFNNKSDILRYFVDANNLIEKNWRHVVNKKMGRETIGWDFSYVTTINAAVDWQKVYSDNINYTISDEEIGTMIKDLNIDQAKYKGNIGMVLIEENSCKTKPRQTIALVFFSVNDLNPLFIKRYSVKPSGYGFLSYWGLTNAYPIVKADKIKKEIQ